MYRFIHKVVALGRAVVQNLRGDFERIGTKNQITVLLNMLGKYEEENAQLKMSLKNLEARLEVFEKERKQTTPE